MIPPVAIEISDTSLRDTDSANNLAIYDAGWDGWIDMKRYGPASRWLRSLIAHSCSRLEPVPATILDVGCGEGSNTVMLAELFPNAHVWGSDFSVTAIEMATRHAALPNLTFVHDFDNRLLEKHFDLVCTFEVLEHIHDWHGLLASLAAASNRYLLLSFPTGRMRRFEKNIGHVRNFQRGEVEAELARASFHPINVSYAGFPFYSPLYREFCQITNAGANSLTRGSYGLLRRSISTSLYILFRFCSTQRVHGDQFVGLFARNGESPS